MPSWSERALDFPLLSLPRRGNQLGVVGNTPVIVKYPFWQMTLANAKAVYACLNYGEAFARARLQTGVSALTGTSATCLRLCPCHYCEPSVQEAEVRRRVRHGARRRACECECGRERERTVSSYLCRRWRCGILF